MNENTTLQNEPSVPAAVNSGSGPSIEFFAIGLALNVILIAAYFLWALRQGKKRNKPED